MRAHWRTIPVAGGLKKKVLVNQLPGTNLFVAENTKPQGYIYVSRWVKQKDAKPKLLFQRVRGLNHAIKQQYSILKGYGLKPGAPGEIQDINQMNQTIKEAHGLLMQWRKTRPLDARQRKIVEKKLVAAGDQLFNAINGFKERAADYLFDASALEDGLARRNPSALCAKVITANTSLLDRLAEIGVIRPAIAFRKQAVVFERRRIESVLTEIRNQFSLMKKMRAFKEPERARQSEITGVKNQLIRLRSLLNTVRVFPYRGPSQRMAGDLNKAIKALDADQTNEAKIGTAKVALNSSIKRMRVMSKALGKVRYGQARLW